MFCFRSCYFSLCPSCISYLFDLFALLLLYISTFAFVCLCLDFMPVPFSSPQDQDEPFYDLLVLLLVCLLLLYFAYFCCLLLILFCYCSLILLLLFLSLVVYFILLLHLIVWYYCDAVRYIVCNYWKLVELFQLPNYYMQCHSFNFSEPYFNKRRVQDCVCDYIA